MKLYKNFGNRHDTTNSSNISIAAELVLSGYTDVIAATSQW